MSKCLGIDLHANLQVKQLRRKKRGESDDVDQEVSRLQGMRLARRKDFELGREEKELKAECKIRVVALQTVHLAVVKLTRRTITRYRCEGSETKSMK